MTWRVIHWWAGFNMAIMLVYFGYGLWSDGNLMLEAHGREPMNAATTLWMFSWLAAGAASCCRRFLAEGDFLG